MFDNYLRVRHYFVNKGPSSLGYGFSSSHVWIWVLDYKESWVTENWCFWTVVLEKTLESPLDSKQIQPVHPKGDQSWVFTGRTVVEAETPILWPPVVKSWFIWKELILEKIEGRRRRGRQDEMVGWHHHLNGHELEQALGVSDGQGSLVCCRSWGRKELDTTEGLNWTKDTKIGAPMVAQMVSACPFRRPGFDPWVRKTSWRRKY